MAVRAAIIGGLKRSWGLFRPGRFRLCHRVMAVHRRLRRMPRHRLAHAVHGLRQGSTRHRHRPEGRGEHNQQQKSGSPAVSTPHLRNSIAENQFPVLSSQFSAKPLPLATGYSVLIPVPFLRARAGRAAVKDNSKAGVDSRRGPRGGGGFRWSGFRRFALPAAGVASRVGNRAVGCACQSQAARRQSRTRTSALSRSWRGSTDWTYMLREAG